MQMEQKHYMLLGGGLLVGAYIGWWYAKRPATPAASAGQLHRQTAADRGRYFAPDTTASQPVINLPYGDSNDGWWSTEEGIRRFLSSRGLTCAQWMGLPLGTPEYVLSGENPVPQNSKWVAVLSSAGHRNGARAISAIDAYCARQVSPMYSIAPRIGAPGYRR